MKTVAVVTDSVACLPQDLVARHGILVVPVRLAVGGQVFRDIAEELTPQLIRDLQQAATIDTTPWPPESYRHAYEAAGKAARDVVHIVAFSQFTSTMSLARAGATMAQEAHPGLRVEVFDSATTTMAQGFVALAAARAATRGGNIADVLAEADRVKARVNAAFALDSLRFIARTGRVNRLAGWAGSLLRVRPVVGLSNGRERPIALTRSRSQGTRRLFELIRASSTTSEPLHVAIMESGRTEESAELRSLIDESLHPAEMMVAQVSPVTQVVAGPGLLGVAFYSGD
jgi:DegV family protein with EDD domain